MPIIYARLTNWTRFSTQVKNFSRENTFSFSSGQRTSNISLTLNSFHFMGTLVARVLRSVLGKSFLECCFLCISSSAEEKVLAGMSFRLAGPRCWYRSRSTSLARRSWGGSRSPVCCTARARAPPSVRSIAQVPMGIFWFTASYYLKLWDLELVWIMQRMWKLSHARGYAVLSGFPRSASTCQCSWLLASITNLPKLSCQHLLQVVGQQHQPSHASGLDLLAEQVVILGCLLVMWKSHYARKRNSLLKILVGLIYNCFTFFLSGKVEQKSQFKIYSTVVLSAGRIPHTKHGRISGEYIVANVLFKDFNFFANRNNTFGKK